MLIPRVITSQIAHVLVTIGFLTAIPLIAVAQNAYPNRPIKIIVPLSAGATADFLPRIVAEKLSLRWGQPVIIENRPGAALNLGAEVVARAEPDGYTLLASPPVPLVIAQSLYSELPFDPTAFVPVTVLCTLPNTLIARPNLPVANLAELVAYAKKNPGELTYASAGRGSTPHLAGEAFQIAAEIRMVHIPYKGLAPALTDVLAGHVDMMFDNIGNTLVRIKQGTVKGIAVTSKERVPDLPELPTLAETYPGFYSATWFAVVAPPRTPPEIAAKLSQAIAEILKLPDVLAKFKTFLCSPVGSSPAETATFLKEERERWHKVIETAGIKPE
jgi:tripartite-type tricarboxylate transporter receptor subunit TctC